MSHTRASVVYAVAALIAVYGGLLRLDAFVGKYGVLDHPGWARVLTQDVAPLAARLRPSSVTWGREATPYAGGDPINYLKFAREMTSFYQAHVREPVFLALTRAWLWALAGQDAAVSFASLTGSTLAVFAVFLLGSAVMSRPAGVIAALLMAMEHEAITWAPDGWRDDTFTAAVLFAAWALVRLRQRPSTGRAIAAGLLCAICCLTRITAVSFVLPGLIWLAAGGGAPPRRDRTRQALVAFIVLAAAVTPYLIRCAIVFGDPLVSINYHTVYYRHAEGMSIDHPMTASAYLRTKLAARPIATIDTAFNGLFVQPFITKWNGFTHWSASLAPVLEWLAVIGLGGLAFSAAGRLLLVLLVTSIFPYMVTWNVGGGGEWRFTMHAYPFYIVAAACAVVGLVRLGRTLATGPRDARRATIVRVAVRAAGVVAIAFVGVAIYFGSPWFVTREAIAKGESTSVETGERDLVFYRTGWSPWHREGVTVRVSRGERSSMHIPLPERRNYDLVLRIDPADPAAQQRVSVLFNGHLVGLLRLSWNPERVGSYRVRVQEHMVKGSNELTIIPAPLVAAASAGPRFAWLDPADRIGVRLWYVRVLPLP